MVIQLRPFLPRTKAAPAAVSCSCVLACIVFAWTLAAAEPAPQYRAARSVHLGYLGPGATAFYLEMAVEKSTAGSYFMACGWNTGYFGIQELGNGRKVAIFSVWDPTAGDDPNAVNVEERVEVLHQGDGVRIRRFGGEGTGGQCMTDFDWQLGQTNRFLVTATVDPVTTTLETIKTAYAGWLWLPDRSEWKHLVTFRTRTVGQSLHGLYSFIEDFRRDSKSVQDVRRARFFNGWVRPLGQPVWMPVTKARFTASGAEWESKENIDAGFDGAQFYLITGGATKMSRELRSVLTLPSGLTQPPADLPPPLNRLPRRDSGAEAAESGDGVMSLQNVSLLDVLRLYRDLTAKEAVVQELLPPVRVSYDLRPGGTLAEALEGLEATIEAHGLQFEPLGEDCVLVRPAPVTQAAEPGRQPAATQAP